MNLHVFFSPAEVASVQPSANAIYIIIDVIRATTSLAVIFEQGASRVLVAPTIEQARQAAHHKPGRLLCGERNVRPLLDFDYGNSPTHFSHANLKDRELVLTTTNGTRAFFACPSESTRLAGCFYNARAVTTYALAQARQQHSNIAIVCAAEHGYFALDDAVCAGYLVQELLQQQSHLQLHESALAAQSLYHTYLPPRFLNYCNSARKVIEAGLRSDLDFCSTCNVASSVPLIIGEEPATGLLILEPA